MIQDHNIPQGYKQTELGIIPEDWEVKKICEGLADVKSGKRLPSGYYVTDQYTRHPYIRVIDMYDGGIDTSNLMYVPDEAYKPIEKYRIFKDDIFISVAGTLGIVGKIPDRLDGANLTENANRLTNITCNRDYLLYYLRSPYIQDVISSEQTIGAQPKLALMRIRNFDIALPKDIAEQRAIAEALSDMDGLIAALDKKIAKKRLLKQGAMQQLLTGKKRLPGFTDEWVSVQLKEICSFQNGYTPSKTVRHFWENGTVPWFRMEDIRTNGRILNHAIQHVTNAAVKGDLFPAGSIIMSTTATIGEHALLIVDSLANQQFTNLVIRKLLDKQVDTMWFYHYCYILGEWCRNNINDGGLAAVNMDDFSNVHITLPPILEQQAIATILSDMDKEIVDLEAQRDKYRLLKSGMMQKLLTGQIRLKIE